MPCAPQSITELDQALGLAAGIFSFFVAEIGYPYMQRRKKQRQERIEFEQETTRRFGLGDMPYAGELPQASLGSFGPGIRISQTPVDVSGRDTRSAGTRRVIPGIAAEEGRAQEAGRK